ncbi:hypothetical protein ACP4OV_022317 [Aristida adscensionis]
MPSSGTPAGGADEMDGESGRRRVSGGVDPAADGVDIGQASGSAKRKAAVMPTESDDLVWNEKNLDEPCEVSLRISKEIENLRSQLAKKKEELSYFQENKKLRVELSMKVKDMECLRKQNEELKAKNEGLQNNNGGAERKLKIRRELIMRLEDKPTGRAAIGIKRMGELDKRPFQNACKEKFGCDDYETKAAELVWIWEEELKKPSWHPFKITALADGEVKESIDCDDAKLKFLSLEYGDDVCDAVKTALLEMNEYNPSGRYSVPELWNFRKGRKATMAEVLKYMFWRMEKKTKRWRVLPPPPPPPTSQ